MQRLSCRRCAVLALWVLVTSAAALDGVEHEVAHAHASAQPQLWMGDRAAAFNRGVELYRRGRASRYESHISTAVRLLRRSIALEPKHSGVSQAHFYLGASQALLGDIKSALEHYQRSLELTPRSAASWHNIGVLHERQQSWHEASAAYRRSAALERPNSKQELLQRAALGKVLYSSGMPHDGALEFARAISIATAGSPGELARLHYKQGRAEELYGNSGHDVVASNFSAAMAFALRDVASRWHSRIAGTSLQVVTGWRDALDVELQVLHHGQPSVIAATLQRWVWLCGNDAVVVAPAYQPGLDPPLVFVPFLSEQTEWHTQLPQQLPSVGAGTTLPRIKRGVLLAQTFATGYYHVLVDLLPRIIIAKELLLDTDQTTKFIIQSDYGSVMKPYLVQLLALLRLSPERIRPYEVQAIDGDGNTASTDTGMARLAVDELIVIDWNWDDENGGSSLQNQRLVPEYPQGRESESAPLRRLRNIQLPPTQLRHCPPAYALERTRTWGMTIAGGRSLEARERLRTLVFVSRRRAQTRKLTEEFERRLLGHIRGLFPSEERWNMVVYSDSALPSMEEAIRMFGSASIVVGVHGAGLSHIVFCLAGTQVVEIALPEPHALYFEHMSANLGLDYAKVMMRGLGLYGAPVLPQSAVDEAAVIAAISQAIAKVGAESASSVQDKI